MKTFFYILLYFVLGFAVAAQAKRPGQSRSRGYYARQYRKVCQQRTHRPHWHVVQPQRY